MATAPLHHRAAGFIERNASSRTADNRARKGPFEDDLAQGKRRDDPTCQNKARRQISCIKVQLGVACPGLVFGELDQSSGSKYSEQRARPRVVSIANKLTALSPELRRSTISGA
jgi:hypothetical protein